MKLTMIVTTKTTMIIVKVKTTIVAMMKVELLKNQPYMWEKNIFEGDDQEGIDGDAQR